MSPTQSSTSGTVAFKDLAGFQCYCRRLWRRHGGLNHHCGTGGRPVTSFSSALSGLAVNIVPSIASIQARRSRSVGFVWRLRLIVTAEDAPPEKGEISVTLLSNSRI
jgi:hypothetical protein